jgi:hypothetical protein
MVKSEKKSYFHSIKPRYEKASKAQKKIILDEFCENCKYNRKYAIRLLGSKIYKRRKIESSKKNGRKSTYNSDELIEVIKFIWLKTNQLCSKRLKVALPIWLPYYPKILSDQTLALWT